MWRRIERHRALEVHFNLALRAYEDKDRTLLVRHMRAIAVLPEGGTGCIEYLALSWRLKWLEGDGQAAVETARLAVHLFPDDIDTLLEFGQVLIDTGRALEAVRVLEDATVLAPDDADIWYELGIAAEHCDQLDLRFRAFHRAWRIESLDEEVEHRYLDDDRIQEIVEVALARLPAHLRAAVGNLAITIEEYPAEWVVTEANCDPRVLGLFDGPTYIHEHSLDTVIDGPSRIYIYRRNVERQCADTEEAEHQIALTVLHELGHYFGLEEPDLERLGLN